MLAAFWNCQGVFKIYALYLLNLCKLGFTKKC